MTLATETVILAGTWADAQKIAERLQLKPDEWVMPRRLAHIRGRAEAPVYFDFGTFERNPARESLREWFAWRLTPPSRRPPQLPGKLNLPKEDQMPTNPSPAKTPANPTLGKPAGSRPWFVGIARQVGLDYLNQTDGNVVAIDADGDRWTPHPVTGEWTCPDLSDQIAPEFGPFDVYAA